MRKAIFALALIFSILFLLGCTDTPDLCGDGICSDSEQKLGDCPTDCGGVIIEDEYDIIIYGMDRDTQEIVEGPGEIIVAQGVDDNFIDAHARPPEETHLFAVEFGEGHLVNHTFTLPNSKEPYIIHIEAEGYENMTVGTYIDRSETLNYALVREQPEGIMYMGDSILVEGYGNYIGQKMILELIGIPTSGTGSQQLEAEFMLKTQNGTVLQFAVEVGEGTNLTEEFYDFIHHNEIIMVQEIGALDGDIRYVIIDHPPCTTCTPDPPVEDDRKRIFVQTVDTTGTPISFVQTQIYVNGDLLTSGKSTNSDGELILIVGIDGDYTAVLEKEGYETTTENLQLKSEGDPAQVITLTKNTNENAMMTNKITGINEQYLNPNWAAIDIVTTTANLAPIVEENGLIDESNYYGLYSLTLSGSGYTDTYYETDLYSDPADALALVIMGFLDPTNASAIQTRNIYVVMNGGAEEVCLPAFNIEGYFSRILYVGSDGSTYENSTLTDLARSC